MPYLYYILLSLLLLSACQGGDQNQITVDNAQSRNTTGPKYVKSVQFVYPMKFDTCRFNEELKIVYANNKHYKIDSAHLFFNQQQIATLDSATREFVFKIPRKMWYQHAQSDRVPPQQQMRGSNPILYRQTG